MKTFPVIVSKSVPRTLGEWSPFNCSFYFSFHEWFELSLFEEGILIVVQNNNMLCFLRPFCWAFVYLIVEYLLDLVCVQWTDPAFALLEPLGCDWATLGGSRNVNASAYLRKIDCWYGCCYQKHTNLVTSRKLWALLPLRTSLPVAEG